MSKAKKKTKLAFWVDTAKVRAFEKAADADGCETISSWIRRACIEKAERTVKAHEVQK